MSPTPKVNREPMAEEMKEKGEFRDDFITLFWHGMERIANVQKQTIDIAVQQHTEMVELVKKVVEKVPGTPGLPMLKVATGAVSRYADTQKAAINLVVEQTHVWTDIFKDRAKTAKSATESTANVAKQTLESSFAVQKKMLENTAAQAKDVIDIAKHQFGLNSAQADAMSNTLQRGVDTIVEAQTELMEMVTH
jgi:hypothetical protein